jgi:hypothetical protein
MEKTVTVKENGIGLMGFIFLVFLALKLTGVGSVANWSWWWVTSPLWLPTAIYLGLIVGLAIIALVIGVFVAIFGR